MKNKSTKLNFSKVNPFDLGTVAQITQQQNNITIGVKRNFDVFSVGGKNTVSDERNYKIKLPKKGG